LLDLILVKEEGRPCRRRSLRSPIRRRCGRGGGPADGGRRRHR